MHVARAHEGAEVVSATRRLTTKVAPESCRLRVASSLRAALRPVGVPFGAAVSTPLAREPSENGREYGWSRLPTGRRPWSAATPAAMTRCGGANWTRHRDAGRRRRQ